MNILNVAISQNYDLEFIHYIISRYENLVDKMDKNGITPLMTAAKHNNIDSANILLENDADINISNDRGQSALIIACEEDNFDIVKLLLENNAKIDEINDEGRTAFIIACYNGYHEIASLLLKYITDPKYVVNKKNYDGDTLLHIACEKDNFELAKVLIEYADILIKNNSKITPLIYACNNNNVELVELLLNHGSNVEVKSTYGHVISNNSFGLSVIKKTTRYYNNVSLKKVSLLVYASYEGYDKIVKLLLDHGANINSMDNSGKTSLSLACEKNHEKCVELLLEYNSNVNTCDNEDKTPLYLAAKNENIKVMDLLLHKHPKDVEEVYSKDISKKSKEKLEDYFKAKSSRKKVSQKLVL